jgi:large subunit ribosomal protein L30|tara:strand:+ start:7449 stop:7628 length:180 start_codon:yes stop_codon:yes gene_type:complete
MLEITLVKSTIGYKPKAKLTIAALGLKKLNQSVIKSDTPQIRGMLNKVNYLVKVTEVNK